MSVGMAILIVGLLALAVLSEGFRSLLVSAIFIGVVGFLVLAFPALQNLLGFILAVWVLWACAYYYVYRPASAILKFVRQKNTMERE